MESLPVAAMTLPTTEALILAEVSENSAGSTIVTSPLKNCVTSRGGTFPTCTASDNLQITSRPL